MKMSVIILKHSLIQTHLASKFFFAFTLFLLFIVISQLISVMMMDEYNTADSCDNVDNDDYDPLGAPPDNIDEADKKADQSYEDTLVTVDFPAKAGDVDSDSDDSIVELEIEKCIMCGESCDSKQLLVKHLALAHFQNGLLQELLSKGNTGLSIQVILSMLIYLFQHLQVGRMEVECVQIVTM